MAAWTYCLVFCFVLSYSSGLSITTTAPPTTTAECSFLQYKTHGCYSYQCYEGRWQPFELMASVECCRKYNNPTPLCYQLHPELRTTPPSWIG